MFMERLLLLVLVLAATAAGVFFWVSQQTGTAEPPMVAAVDYTSETGGADGIALMDLNPNSKTFGKILHKAEVGVGVIPHHLYYNRDGSKLYTTALGGERLYRVWMDHDRIEKITPINTGPCQVGEDMYFSEDGSKFYLTCMGSSMVAVFDARTDTLLNQIQAPAPADAFIKHPHGISVNEQLDLMMVTSTISPALDDPGASVTAIQFSTGNVLATYPVAKTQGTPSAPVEVMFLPNRPIAYVTGMLDASLWKLTWNTSTQSFDAAMFDDGEPRGQSWPLELYIGPDGNLYVSFAQPGAVNVYDIQNPQSPRLIRTLLAGAGAHHILFSDDEKYMFVNNNLLSLPGMNAGTISAVDLTTGKLIAQLDGFVKQGLLPASLVFLGQAHHH